MSRRGGNSLGKIRLANGNTVYGLQQSTQLDPILRSKPHNFEFVGKELILMIIMLSSTTGPKKDQGEELIATNLATEGEEPKHIFVSANFPEELR